jgi:hypothetical protein
MKKQMCVLALVVMFSIAGFSQDKKEKSKEITITGSITDVKCHLNGMSANMGEDHKQCAIDCIKGGVPVGILEAKTEKLYVIIPAKGMKGANEELVKYADKKVIMTGLFMEKSGQKIFFYTKVEEAK